MPFSFHHSSVLPLHFFKHPTYWTRPLFYKLGLLIFQRKLFLRISRTLFIAANIYLHKNSRKKSIRATFAHAQSYYCAMFPFAGFHHHQVKVVLTPWWNYQRKITSKYGIWILTLFSGTRFFQNQVTRVKTVQR